MHPLATRGASSPAERVFRLAGSGEKHPAHGRDPRHRLLVTRSHNRNGEEQTVPVKRNTRQRTAVRDVLHEADRPLSPGEILLGARGIVPEMGMSTVYR